MPNNLPSKKIKGGWAGLIFAKIRLILANYVLFQEKILGIFSMDVRYVDDIFTVFDTSKHNIQNFVKVLNNKFNSISFTNYRKDTIAR